MDENLRRVFDRTRPSPEQKEAMLSRLLEPERKVVPMKKLKKLTVIGIAAALMVISCAAAVVTGLDQRLLDYFGAGEKTELLAEGVVPVGERHTYDNGWTVEIVQLAADRYSLVALVQVTAPEGVRLDGDCYMDLHSEIVPEEGGAISAGPFSFRTKTRRTTASPSCGIGGQLLSRREGRRAFRAIALPSVPRDFARLWEICVRVFPKMSGL